MGRNKIVIFDMDGVLLDSEPIYIAMNMKFFKELGADISLREYDGFIGVSATKMWAYVKEKAGLAPSVEELKETERELKYRTLKEAALTPTEGIVPFLDRLQQAGFTLAIASSGLKKNVHLILAKLGLGDYFDLVVTGEDVERGKPEPDIFLKVAAHYSRPPEDCVVIEDSANGVQAAKAARMACLAYFNPHSGKQDLSKADFIFDRFDDKQLYGKFDL